MTIKPHILLKVILLSTFLTMVACDTTETENNDELMVLDLDTQEAETEFGTLEAKRAEHSYTGPVGEGRAIGITFLEEFELEAGEAPGENEIVVHLYKGDQLAFFLGELDSENSVVLESTELSDFEATVELAIEDGVATGMAAYPEEDPTSFTANIAEGEAGVYWARGTDEEPEVSAEWVVLSDELQWGCVCAPPYGMACCTLQF